MTPAKTRSGGKAQRPRRRPGTPTSRGLPLAAVVAALVAVGIVVVVVTRGSSGGGTRPSAADALAHVHGLGINPGDGDLYAATHFGLFRVPAQGGKALRVGNLVQDTMGFTVVGPDHFLGSGHPDINDQKLRKPGRPPLLGLIETTDGGRTWRSTSLLGEADFHALAAVHGHVYGYDSTSSRFMVSADGKQWDTRSELGLGDFAVDPADADHLVATTDRELAASDDGGRTWEPIDGPRLAFVSWGGELGLWGVSATGEMHRLVDGRWEAREELGGEPQALLVADDRLYAAAAAAGGATAIYVSEDEGRSWQLYYSDRS